MSKMFSAISGASLRTLRRFIRDRRGIAATEFALIVPVMLTLLIGSVEVTRGFAADRKVSLVARAVADLTSQSTAVTSGDMTNILDAAAGIMYPYNTRDLKLKVTAVNVAANGTAKVAWGAARNATKRATGEVVTIPAALRVPNTQLIWGEAEYTYDPALGYVLFNNITLREENFVRPRQGDTVKGPS